MPGFGDAFGGVGCVMEGEALGAVLSSFSEEKEAKRLLKIWANTGFRPVNLFRS